MAPKRKKTYAKRPIVQQKAAPAPAAIRASNNGIQNWQSRLPNFIIGVIAVFALVSLIMLAMQKTPAADVSKKGLFSFFTRSATKPADTMQKEDADNTSGSYTVKEGDFLWSIAEEAYGSGYNAYDIAQANNLEAPYVIEPGQKLTLPKVKPMDPTIGDVPSQVEPTMTKAPETMTTTPKTYTTKDGDFLAQIAQTVYGDDSLWPLIYEANREQIPYPDFITVGETLTIPAKPQAP